VSDSLLNFETVSLCCCVGGPTGQCMRQKSTIILLDWPYVEESHDRMASSVYQQSDQLADEIPKADNSTDRNTVRERTAILVKRR
jgi:hypothetical protein